MAPHTHAAPEPTVESAGCIHLCPPVLSVCGGLLGRAVTSVTGRSFRRAAVVGATPKGVHENYCSFLGLKVLRRGLYVYPVQCKVARARAEGCFLSKLLVLAGVITLACSSALLAMR